MINRRTTAALIAATTAALAIALTGCATPVSAPTPDPSDRDASVRGSRLCIINNSSTAMTITWRGFADARGIPAGGQQCNSGYEVGHLSDVKGVIEYAVAGQPGGVDDIFVFANNDYIGLPVATVAIDPSGIGDGMGACGVFDVDYTRNMDTGWLHGSIQRIADSSDNKEFVLILTDNVGQPSGEECMFNR